jgi:chitin disaccharide deacetylase
MADKRRKVNAMKQLIVNADDYGHTPGLSRGILDAHRQGIVTSTSVMVGSPQIEAAIAQVRTQAPELGLGLHFTLSGRGNRPLLPAHQVPSLVQADGTFYPFEAWFEHYAEFSAMEIAQEYAAQCERYIALAGGAPDHLDAHHHLAYRHPAILEILFDLARRLGVPVRNAGFDAAGLDELLAPVPERLRAGSLTAIKALLARDIPPHPDRFESTFYDEGATLENMLTIIAGLPDGATELMCHPGYADAALISDYTAMREQELAILTHPDVRVALAANHVDLVTYQAVSFS